VLDLVHGDWLRTHFEPRSWEWIDDRLLVCRERLLAADGERLITREIVLDVENGVVADRFYAERLYRRAAVERLLECVGFTAIRFVGSTELMSNRNGDLGMMARGNWYWLARRGQSVLAELPDRFVVHLASTSLQAASPKEQPGCMSPQAHRVRSFIPRLWSSQSFALETLHGIGALFAANYF
jgi:hypothetical protein